MRPRNLAARAGRWSAQHRRIAILGWIAFVVAATVGGGMIGTNQLAPAEMGNGSSKAADLAVDAAGLRDSQRRAGARAGALGPHLDGRAPSGDRRAGEAARRRAPRRAGRLRVRCGRERPGQQGRALGAAVVRDRRRRPTRPPSASTRRSPRPAAVQARHPGLRVEQIGSASADKAFERSLGDDFKRAETLSVPLTLLILLVAFGAARGRRPAAACSA